MHDLLIVLLILYSFAANKKAAVTRSAVNGTPEMIRTSDARFRKPTLYPLSYWGRYNTILTSILVLYKIKISVIIFD